MKKVLISTLILMMLFCMCTAAYADTGATDATASLASELVITMVVRVAGTLLITLIGAFGTWLALKIGKYEQLQNINVAIKEVVRATKITVGELQQTVVDRLKADAADGKLTKEEIKRLGEMLLSKTKEKMSAPTYELLEAAQVDVEALIVGAGESWIKRISSGDTTETY